MMKSLLLRVGFAALVALTSITAPAATPPARVESLTLKEVISRLDQVDFDLQGIEGHINEFRKDVQAGLGNAAAIRVLDIGVGLVRSRVQLNRAPQLIGAMQRESRTDSWQRGRQEEMMKRQGGLLGKHGNLYRIVQGYAADVKERFGIDLESFLEGVESAMERGDSTVDAKVGAMRKAISTGDKAQAARITEALTTGSDIPPSAGTNMNGGGSSQIVSAVPHPTRPGYYIVKYADGREEVVPGRDNGNGTATFTLPNGQTVTSPVMGGSSGSSTGGGAYVPGQANGIGGGGTGPGGMPGGEGGGLAPNVRAAPGGGFIVTETLANGEKVERYFPPNFQGVGTRYLGEQGTRLTEETRETLDKETGQIQRGQAIRWQFAITPAGQAPDPSGGVKASFRFSDRSGQGKYTVTGWKISQPDGSVVANGAGEEASAVARQSGNYLVEFSGKTEWGSDFRIEVQIPIAVN